MGISIVQKSNLQARKQNAKVALVLAGGAVTGGAFKLGGLKALDDFLVNRKTTEFDTYVGLSAGAVLAAALAAGICPAEMLKSLEGKSTALGQFRAADFYHPNVRECIESPLRYALAAALFLPGAFADVVRGLPDTAAELRRELPASLTQPLGSLQALLRSIAQTSRSHRPFPSLLDHLPTGLFDNASIEQYVRRNLARAGVKNDFRALHRRTKRALYIAATNLDTAERVVFGHDEDATLTISEAVQASTALPGFYRPARINGVDYVDGGVRRTANLDVAIEHGADLVICYNPFRPLSDQERRRTERQRGPRQRIADGGVLSILNQVFRTLLHSRLQYALRQYQNDPNFRGDIIVTEPAESDFHFFRLNALAYWQRLRAAQYGYASVSQSIGRQFDHIKTILEPYGITMTRHTVRQGLHRMRAENAAEVTSVLTRDVPRRRLRVA